MSTSRPTVPARAALALVLALVLAACGGPSAAEPAPAEQAPPGEVPHADADADADADVDVAAAADRHLLTVTTHIEGPGGRSGEVVIRFTVVGERRHVRFDSPLGSMGEHVVAPGHHWFRLSALTAEPLGLPTDWIHLPLGELQLAGGALPPELAEVRGPLPDPDSVRAGDVLYDGRQVLDVRHLDDGTARLRLDDGHTVELAQRPLPPGTTVEPPASAIDVRELERLLSLRRG